MKSLVRVWNGFPYLENKLTEHSIFAVYNLVYDVDVKETNAKIEKYKAEHQDIIAAKANKKVIAD